MKEMNGQTDDARHGGKTDDNNRERVATWTAQGAEPERRRRLDTRCKTRADGFVVQNLKILAHGQRKLEKQNSRPKSRESGRQHGFRHESGRKSEVNLSRGRP